MSTPDLQTVVKYLMGEGPLCGVWFGEDHPDKRFGRFWWRRHLRSALASPAAQAEDAARYRWLRDHHNGPNGIHKALPYIAAGEDDNYNWALVGKRADEFIDRERKRTEGNP